MYFYVIGNIIMSFFNFDFYCILCNSFKWCIVIKENLVIIILGSVWVVGLSLKLRCFFILVFAYLLFLGRVKRGFMFFLNIRIIDNIVLISLFYIKKIMV